MRNVWIGGLALLSGVFTGCLAPGGDRPSFDAAVGRASAPGAEVTVDDGLGAVRDAAPGALTLWAGAPVLTTRLRFDAGAPDAWAITVNNCLPDATLTVTTKDARPLAVTASTGAVPTERHFLFSRGKEAALTLTLRPPDADDPAPWRFALLSDVQEAIPRVQDIYSRMNQDPAIRFVLSAGDLTANGKPEEFERYQRELRSLQVPYYATLGNHDIATADGIYQKYFGRGSYRFLYRGVQFTLLDSASASIDPAVYQELDGWLAEGRGRVHVVAMHVPPIDPVGERNAAFSSRDEAASLLARLSTGNVDLTLYGHIHAFYTYENAGIPAFISGGGGAHPEEMSGIGRHYLTVDLGATRVAEIGVVRVDP